MREKTYKIVEAEAERLRQLLNKRVADAAKECSQIRMNLGALKTSSRQKALLLVRRMEELDDALNKAKFAINALQKSVDLDLRRVGVVRQEEHARHERIRQERLENLRRMINQRRERRKFVVVTD